MIKNILYAILSIVILTFAACSSNDKADFDLQGRWHVYERVFACSDASIQTRVNNIFYPTYLKEGSDTYFEFTYENQSGEGIYREELKKWIVITEGKDSIQEAVRYYSGGYTADYDKGTFSATINSVSPNWVTTNGVRDLNKQHIHFVQEMNSADIKRFLEIYFDSQETVPEGVTATWSVKALKE